MAEYPDERAPLLPPRSDSHPVGSCSYPSGVDRTLGPLSNGFSGNSTPRSRPRCDCQCSTHLDEVAPTTRPKPSVSFWSSLFDSEFVSLSLENSGSVARDHLASERTFLAYVRTSLAVASSGVALIQLFTAASRGPGSNVQEQLLAVGRGAERYIRPLGCITVLIGISILVIGITRFFVVQSALIQGKYPAARLAIGFLAVSMSALVALTFAVMVAGNLDNGQ